MSKKVLNKIAENKKSITAEKAEATFSFSKISPQMRTAFFSSILFGLVAHGMGLFNKFSWHDDIIGLFWVGTTIPSGRWMLHVVGWLETIIFGDGHFSLPLVNGLFSLICIGLAAMILVKLLNIQSRAYCAGLGGLMAAFPVVAGLFGYMFTVPYYMLAMLMMTVSAYFSCKMRTWWFKVAAIVLSGCAMGIYQAFLPLMLSIPLLYDLTVLAEGEEKTSVFLRRAASQVLCVLGALAFYLAANWFFLTKFNLKLNNNMGIDQVSTTSLTSYLERAAVSYREFFRPTRNVSSDMFPMHVYYTHLIMVCGDLLLGTRLVLRIGQKNKGNAAMILMLLTLMPLACNFIFIMAEETHGLMMYGQIMQFTLFVWLLDQAEFQRLPLQKMAAGIAVAVLVLTGAMYVRFDNQCYLKTLFQQEQAISWFTTLTSRIKSTEGFQDETPVVFLNGGHVEDQTLYNIGELDFIQLPPYEETSTGYINSYAWRAFMERWSGFCPKWADEADYANLPEVQTMPHYPDDGSIRKLGEAVVVNF